MGVQYKHKSNFRSVLIIIIFLLLIGLFTLQESSAQSSNYYYANEKKIYLEEVANKKIYRFDTNKEKTIKLKPVELKQVYPQSFYYKIDLSDQGSSNIEKAIRYLRTKSTRELPVYREVDTKEELIITDDYLVSFRKDLTDEELTSIIQNELNSEIVESLHYVLDGKGYHLKLKEPLDNVISVSDKCVESGWCIWAHPNFIRKVYLHSTPSDPYFPNQWHLKNTGQNGGISGADINVESAWDLTKGNSNITIAIVDDGFDWDHEEFSAPGKITKKFNLIPGENPNDPRLVASGTFEDIKSSLSAEAFSHGTPVGGLAAAPENNIGVVGVCPNCMLMPLRVATDKSEGTQFTNSIYLSTLVSAIAIVKGVDEGADVINCSWGYMSPVIPDNNRNAIDYALQRGRNGKGAILVFSAGNGTNQPPPNCGTASVSAPANYLPVIAVGATDKNDKITCYSSTGPEVDIVAPGGFGDPPRFGDIVSTDLLGIFGRSPTNAKQAFALTATNFGGHWKLTLGDSFKGYTGTLNEWSLEMEDVNNQQFKFTSPSMSVPIPDGFGSTLPLIPFLGPLVETQVTPTVPSNLREIFIKTIYLNLNITHPFSFDLAGILTEPYGGQTNLNFSTLPNNFTNGNFVPINKLPLVVANQLPNFQLDSKGNYTNDFNGTSAAAPIVSGLVGLILSANPNLTFQQVDQILKDTADKIDPSFANYDSNGHSNIYGYGRINAYKAVQKAKDLFVQQPAPSVSSTPVSNPQPTPVTNPTPTPITNSNASIQISRKGKISRNGFSLSAVLNDFPNDTHCDVTSKIGALSLTTVPSSLTISGSSTRTIRVIIPKQIQKVLKKLSNKTVITEIDCPSIGINETYVEAIK